MKSRIFENKIALVVGASGGIGSALIKKLKKEKVVVIESSISQSRYKLDISSSRQIEALAKEIENEFNNIDFLFNASGIAYYKTLTETSIDEINKVIKINLIGAIELTQKFIPLMNNGGTIVHLGSMAGICKGHKYFSVYSASKEGLAGFLRSVSAEFPGINFILVTPAGVNTNIARKAIGGVSLLKKFRESYSNLDTPADIATGILNNIEHKDRDVRIFPTKLSKETYDELRK